MAGSFNPYHQWLGIPPEEQPANHYRLLGVAAFETDPNVIANAADQRMANLRQFEAGPHGKVAAQLLNEVAVARICLLNAGKKAEYDDRLRAQLTPVVARQSYHISPPPPPRTPHGPPCTPHGPREAVIPHGDREEHAAPPLEPTRQYVATEQLGDYRLLEKLGQGGMGVVYKALHTKLGRHVAVKVLTGARLRDAQAIARFEREMLAAGRVDHPNVVRALDAREFEGTRFLVMELIDGLDLNDVVRRVGPLRVADACEVVRQAALGLQSAHENQLVHRDVKPSNLMLTAAGGVKLLDLGLARFEVEQIGDEMTGTGTALGTLDYMAPEQASNTHAADIRADIYALGCTLYKLLAGRAPFDDPQWAAPLDKLRAHAREAPPPLSTFRHDVPKELAAIVNRMMAKDPARRFATPGAVADAVGPLAAAADLVGLLAKARQLPPTARPSQSLAGTHSRLSSGLTQFLQAVKPGKAAKKSAWAAPQGGLRRWLLVGVGAALAVLVVGIALIWASRSGSPSQTSADADTARGERAEGRGQKEDAETEAREGGSSFATGRPTSAPQPRSSSTTKRSRSPPPRRGNCAASRANTASASSATASSRIPPLCASRRASASR